MARIRSLKPEMWSSESVGRLSRYARLLLVELITQVDDEGRIRASSRLIKDQGSRIRMGVDQGSRIFFRKLALPVSNLLAKFLNPSALRLPRRTDRGGSPSQWH